MCRQCNFIYNFLVYAVISQLYDLCANVENVVNVLNDQVQRADGRFR